MGGLLQTAFFSGPGKQVLRYLGAYTHRGVAISNHRLVSFVEAPGDVPAGATPLTKAGSWIPDSACRRILASRFLLHVLPRGFVQIPATSVSSPGRRRGVLVPLCKHLLPASSHPRTPPASILTLIPQASRRTVLDRSCWAVVRRVVIERRYRRPDQAPFSAGSPGRLRCRSVFIAERPTLRQEVATAALATSQFSSGPASLARLSGILPPILCPHYNHDLHPCSPPSIPTCCLPMSLHSPRTAAVQSKCIAASCQSGEASFIAPSSRNHRGHAFALRSSRSLYVSRGASDTVLSNIGSLAGPPLLAYLAVAGGIYRQNGESYGPSRRRPPFSECPTTHSAIR